MKKPKGNDAVRERFDHDMAKHLYVQGLSLRQVASRMGVSHQAVHKALVAMGVELRGRGGNQGAHRRRR
jgi:transcriptional regulator of aromatic amino acid metabolism